MNTPNKELFENCEELLKAAQAVDSRSFADHGWMEARTQLQIAISKCKPKPLTVREWLEAGKVNNPNDVHYRAAMNNCLYWLPSAALDMPMDEVSPPDRRPR